MEEHKIRLITSISKKDQKNIAKKRNLFIIQWKRECSFITISVWCSGDFRLIEFIHDWFSKYIESQNRFRITANNVLNSSSEYTQIECYRSLWIMKEFDVSDFIHKMVCVGMLSGQLSNHQCDFQSLWMGNHKRSYANLFCFMASAS